MTLQDLFVLEDIRGAPTVNPASGTPAMFKLGLRPSDNKAIHELMDDLELNEKENLAVRYVELTKGNSTIDDLMSSFLLINCIPIFLMEGLATGTAGSYEITYFSTTDKPSIAIFVEGDAMKSYVKGLVAQQLSLTFQTGMEGVLAQLSKKGMAHGISTAVPTSTYPDDEDKPFNVLNYWNWNASAYAIKAINVQWTEQVSGLIGDNGYYQYIGTTAPIKNIVTVNFKDGLDVTTIKADQRAGTSRTMEFKFSKSSDAAKYWIRSQSYICLGIKWARVKGMPDQLVGVFWATGAPTNTVVDGITTDAFYGL